MSFDVGANESSRGGERIRTADGLNLDHGRSQLSSTATPAADVF
jgi:hypothetical protein